MPKITILDIYKKKAESRKIIMLAALLSALLSWTSVASAAQPASAAGEPTRSYGSIDVVLYVTSWCPYCNKAREFLKSTGVTLMEYDIEKDAEKAQEMISKSGSRGVPVVDVEGIIIRGYSIEAMRNAIERKRRE